MTWDYRKYGTLPDPIHKSHLQSITGDYGCLVSFRRSKDIVADGGSRESETECNARSTAGIATHECVARALGNAGVLRKLLKGDGAIQTDNSVRVYKEEFAKVVAGREVRWFDDTEEELAQERGEMIAGLLNDVRNHVISIRLLEAGFIVRIGDYWCSGHVDLVYEPVTAPGALAMADWKTGKNKPHPIELDHSWESGIYAAAMKSGLWIKREHIIVPPDAPNPYEYERLALEAELIRVAGVYTETGELLPHVTMLDEFPSDIRYVHMADYPPYKKKGKKEAKRPEELAFYGLTQPGQVSYEPGKQRGPAWYKVRRADTDHPRLESLLRNVVGTVRMGRFFESVGEKCQRCPHQQPCLNSGYEVRGSERDQLERALKTIPVDDDGFGNVA